VGFFNRTPYQRSNSGHEHLIASMQPRKYSKKNFKTELQKKPKTTSKVLEEPIVLSYEELRGLSDPGLQDCVHNIVHTGLGDRTCPILMLYSTRMRSRTSWYRRKLLELYSSTVPWLVLD
jgi:hypothetical protein